MFCGGAWRPGRAVNRIAADEEAAVQLTDMHDMTPPSRSFSVPQLDTGSAAGTPTPTPPPSPPPLVDSLTHLPAGAADGALPSTPRVNRNPALWIRALIGLLWFAIISGFYTAASYWTQYNNLGILKQNPYVIWPGIYLAATVVGGPVLVPLMIILDCAMYHYVYLDKLGPITPLLPYYILKGVIFMIESALIRMKVDLRFITWAAYMWVAFITCIFHCLLGVVLVVTYIVWLNTNQPNLIVTRAFSDMTGLVTVGPTIFLVIGWSASRYARGCRRPKIQEVLRGTYYFFITALLWFLAFVFSGTQNTTTFFLHFVPTLYMACVYGRMGGMLSAMCSTLLLVGILQARATGINGQLASFQLFVIVLAGLGLIVGIIVDIERRKERELRDVTVLLERRNVDLEAAILETKRLAQMKARFLDDISHEVRTPLHGMLGYLTLLQASPLTPAQRRWVTTMRGSAGLLVSIVDDLLDISKVSTGRDLAIRPVTFQLAGAIEEALSLTAGMKILHQVELMSVVGPDVAVLVYADRQNLQRVILNLLSNALKFTQQGSVILSARLEDETQNDLTVKVMVSDTGVGITPEDQEKLFQRFTQVGTTGSGTAMKGTGLGLAISKELVESTMKGKIGCDSKLGAGTTFWFTAVLSRASDMSPPPLHGAYMTRCPSVNDLACIAGNIRGIVVHWAPKIRDEIQRIFTTMQCSCQTTGSLDDATDLIFAAAQRDLTAAKLAGTLNGRPSPFVVIVDSQFDAAEIVLFSMRTHPSDGAPVHVVVATHSPETMDEQLRPGAGFVHEVLRKALSFGTIALLLRSIVLRLPFEEGMSMGSPPAGSVVTSNDMAETPPENFTGVRVLVADDNPVNRELAHELLLNAGIAEHDILVANDGEETVRVWEQALGDSRGKVSIILMDCMMPVLDGFDAAKRIRQKEETLLTKDERGVPIVAVTAYSEESCHDRYMTAGMNDFLPKPFSEEALRQCVTRWTRSPLPGETSLGRIRASSSDLADDDMLLGPSALESGGTRPSIRLRVLSGNLGGGAAPAAAAVGALRDEERRGEGTRLIRDADAGHPTSEARGPPLLVPRGPEDTRPLARGAT